MSNCSYDPRGPLPPKKNIPWMYSCFYLPSTWVLLSRAHPPSLIPCKCVPCPPHAEICPAMPVPWVGWPWHGSALACEHARVGPCSSTHLQALHAGRLALDALHPQHDLLGGLGLRSQHATGGGCCTVRTRRHADSGPADCGASSPPGCRLALPHLLVEDGLGLATVARLLAVVAPLSCAARQAETPGEAQWVLTGPAPPIAGPPPTPPTGCHPRPARTACCYGPCSPASRRNSGSWVPRSSGSSS